MAIAQIVQIPARNPAIAPQLISALGAQPDGQEAGGSASNIARLAAMSNDVAAFKEWMGQ